MKPPVPVYPVKVKFLEGEEQEYISDSDLGSDLEFFEPDDYVEATDATGRRVLFRVDACLVYWLE